MVSFICDACGNTVKKNQVEKHYQTQCRNCSVLSCIDCGVDFPGDSYKGHTSCISEAEKYQGHLYQPKGKENKGDAKQKQWLKHVQESSSNVADPKLKLLLAKISEYSNIPRKKKKFENFCKNSVKVYDQNTLDKLWDAFNGSHSTEVNGTVEKGKVETGEGNQNTTADECELDNVVNHSKENKRDKKSKKRKTYAEEHIQDENNDIDENEKNINEVELQEGLVNNSRMNKKRDKKSKKLKKDVAEVLLDENNEISGNEIKQDGKYQNHHVKNIKGNKKRDKNSKKRNFEERGITEDENKKSKKKKRKILEEENNENDIPEEKETSTQNKEKFNWHRTIKRLLKEAEDHELPMKKLRKRVIAAYLEDGPDHRASTTEETRSLFDKKLHTYPKVKIRKEIVKLVK